MITLYFTSLFISPQLWISPFVGIPTDYIIYPLWLVVVMLQGRLPEFFRFQAIDWLFVLLVVWIVMTSIVNPTNARTVEICINYFKWFFLYRFFVVSLPTMAHVRRALWLILVFVMILAVEGIQHKLSVDGLGWAGQPLGWVDPSVLAAGGTGRTQWINIFDGPGVFCVVYTIGLPIALMYLGRPYGVLVRIFGVLMIGTLLVATYYTGSRGGFLATLGILALFLMFRWKVSMTKVGVVSGLFAVAFMLAPSHLTSVRDQNKSAQHRVEMWVEGVEMIQQNPLFGIGKGNFGAYTSKLIAHNSAIEIMGEMGFPGLFFWMSLLYLALRGVYLYRVGPYEEIDRNCATTLFLIIVGYLLSAMFVTLEYETLYMLLGLCAAVGNRLSEPVRFEKRDFKIMAGVTVSWVLLIKVFVNIYF